MLSRLRGLVLHILSKTSGHIAMLQDDGLEEFSNLWGIPFGRPHDATDFASGTIDEQCCGQPHRAECAQCLAGYVNVLRENAEPDFRVEFADSLHSAAVDGNGHDFENRAPQRGLKPIERGHFEAARPAPRGPNV